jgi:hypothetical protein
MKAMLQMTKIDIQGLKQAYDSPEPLARGAGSSITLRADRTT